MTALERTREAEGCFLRAERREKRDAEREGGSRRTVGAMRSPRARAPSKLRRFYTCGHCVLRHFDLRVADSCRCGAVFVHPGVAALRYWYVLSAVHTYLYLNFPPIDPHR